MKSKSIKGNGTSEIQIALDNCLKDGFKPTLAIVFLSTKQDIPSICGILDLAGIAIYGTTTHGEFTDQSISSGETAILLLDLNEQYFTIYFDEFKDGNYRETTKAIATKSLEKFANPCFLIASCNLNTDAEELLHGFEDILGKGANVNGGMAGDDFSFTGSSVFTNHKISNNGIVTVVIDEDKVNIKSKATSGWKAVGTEKTITKSEGNHVYTIDDVPVLDLVIKFGGLKNVTSENFLLETSIALPFQIQRESGDPVMRSGLLVDWSDRSFYCAGTMTQGSKVRFSIPPDFDVIEKVIQGCEHLKETEMPEADAMVIYSCAGRKLSLGPLINEEIEGITNVWNVPMAGMFSSAELGRAPNGNLEMHGLTACCVLLKEK